MSPLMPAGLISAQNHGLPSGTQNIAGWKKSIMNIDMRRCTSQWKSVVDVQTEIRLFSCWHRLKCWGHFGGAKFPDPAQKYRARWFGKG